MTSSKPKVNPTEVAATLRGVTVTYDGYQTRALNHVNVEFHRGEITAVLGGKGAGKSTLLKVLAGRLSATEGTVKVFGRSPRGGVKARVGFLPGMADPNRPAGFVDRLLRRSGGSSAGARSVAQIAQAMVGNRDMVVLDDAFAGLGPAEIAEAKALIRDVVTRGKTVVLGSDALMDVVDICSRFVILHEGRKQAAGTLQELLASGVAIRLLPEVLPGEMVERVLSVLRGEILSAANTSTATLPKPENPAAASPVKLVKSKPDDSIDHEKLEGLVKPPGGPSKKET